MSDGEITERVMVLRGQMLDLIHTLKSVTSGSWGRLSVFGLWPDIRFLHQFLEASNGANRCTLVLLVREAHAELS